MGTVNVQSCTVMGTVNAKFRDEIVTSKKYSKKLISIKVNKKSRRFKPRILHSTVSHLHTDGTVMF